MGPPWYWFVDGEVIVSPTGLPQARPLYRVAKSEFGRGEGPSVSTVFLGIDHNFSGGPPLVFETMVFWSGHDLDEECDRYATLEEATAGHAAMVKRVLAAIDTAYKAIDVRNEIKPESVIRSHL